MDKASLTFFCVTAVLLVSLHRGATEPADCPLLRSIIPDCSCEAPLDRPNDIVINCRLKSLTSMPLINGSYSGLIYEFTLAKNNIEDIPDDAFLGLNIQRLDVTENKLKNVSQFAFRGLESNLIVLKIGGDATSNVSAPFTAISNLINLQEMFLQNFRAPSNDLEDPNYFQPFSNLLSLTLDNWGLKSIGDDAFRGLTSLKELNLSNHLSLTSYPVGAVNLLESTVEKISITHTGIPSLMFYAFERLQVLKQLVLRSNRISELEDQCFKGLENKLEYLDLSFNSINMSQLVRIQTLEALQNLQLQNVHLGSLPDNAVFLLNKANLKTLNLAANGLISIPSNAFQNLTKLTNLDLSQNRISVMANKSLYGLTSLESLRLDSQDFTGTSLTLPSMAQLTSLTFLTLQSTPVSPQSWARISEAYSLTKLIMRDTGLTAIPDLTFRMMTNLAMLDLSDNQIVNITQETFVGPKTSLVKIYLTNNRIQKFNRCTFYNYTSALELDLVQNPLHCDCSLYWLRNAITDQRITFMTNFETCSYPDVYDGQRFTSLSAVDLCGSPPAPPPCDDYYSTTTAPPPTTTTLPSVTINVVATSTTSNSISITWTLDLPQYITHIVIVYTDIQSGQQNTSEPLSTSTTRYTVTKLKSNTRYQICVEGYRVDGGQPNSHCISPKTETVSPEPQSTTVDPNIGDQMSNSMELGIIIGSVVGGLVLFAVLVAIIYLMVIRKKTPKDKYPVQPRTFTRAELPTVGYDSKRYRKKKKDTTDGNKNDVSVTVISDGKTKPNIGRVSAGSYQYLQDNQPVSGQPTPGPPYLNDAAEKQAISPYENDMDMRPLPQMPKESPGYYNPSSVQKGAVDDTQPHPYSEINL